MLLESQVAVLVAREHGAVAPCMVIASDLSENCEAVLREGLALARARGSDVHLVHACPNAECGEDAERLGIKRAGLEMQLAKVLAGEDPLPVMTTSAEVGSASDVIWE